MSVQAKIFKKGVSTVSYEETIRVIRARNDIDRNTKRKLIYRLKGAAFKKVIEEVINNSWIEDDITVNISSIKIDKDHRVIVICEAWKNGFQLDLDLPFVYVNPPLKISSDDSENPALVLRRIVMDTVRGR